MSHSGAGRSYIRRDSTDPGQYANRQVSHNLLPPQYTNESSTTNHDAATSSDGFFDHSRLGRHLLTDPSDAANETGETYNSAPSSILSQGFSHGPQQNYDFYSSGFALGYSEPVNGTTPNFNSHASDFNKVGSWPPPIPPNTGSRPADVLSAITAPRISEHDYTYPDLSNHDPWIPAATNYSIFQGTYEAQSGATSEPGKLVSLHDDPPQDGSTNIGFPVNRYQNFVGTGAEVSQPHTEHPLHCGPCNKDFKERRYLRCHLLGSKHLNIAFSCPTIGCNEKVIGKFDNLTRHAKNGTCTMSEVKRRVGWYRANLRGFVERSTDSSTPQRRADLEAFRRTYD